MKETQVEKIDCLMHNMNTHMPAHVRAHTHKNIGQDGMGNAHKGVMNPSGPSLFPLLARLAVATHLCRA